MSFKMEYRDFDLLVKYLDKNAKGAMLKIELTQQPFVDISFSNKNDDPVTVRIFEQSDAGTSFPKITITQRLGDEIK